VIDMFTMHMPWTYLPYAAIYKLLGVTIESGRLFSVLSILATVGMTCAMTFKKTDSRGAFWAFLLLGFSPFWVDTNIEVRHSAPANLGLVGAVFVLSMARQKWWALCLAGFLLGIAVNSRVVLAPAATLIALAAWWAPPNGESRSPLIAFLAFVAAGGLLASIPSLWILYVDYEAFYFNYIGARTLFMTGSDNPWTTKPTPMFLVTAWIQFWGLMRVNYFNFALLLPAAFALVCIALSDNRGRLAPWKSVAGHGEDAILWAAIGGTLISYGFADMIVVHYVHHIAPFLVIVGISWWHRARTEHRSRRSAAAMSAVLTAAVFGGGVEAAANPATDTVFRNFHGLKRVEDNTRLACWLRDNIPADWIVFTYQPLPLAMSGHKVPLGMEQGVGGASIFLVSPRSESYASRYRHVSFGTLLPDLAEGRIALIIQDYEIQPNLWPNPETRRNVAQVAEYMRLHYSPVPYTRLPPLLQEERPILLHHSVSHYRFDQLSRPDVVRGAPPGEIRRLLGQGRTLAAIVALLADVQVLTADLPRDLVRSARRIGGGLDCNGLKSS